MYSGELTLRDALAVGLLELFVRQEEERGSELYHGSELERALALLIIQRRLANEWCGLHGSSVGVLSSAS
jgi:hypothetical protein